MGVVVLDVFSSHRRGVEVTKGGGWWGEGEERGRGMGEEGHPHASSSYTTRP